MRDSVKGPNGNQGLNDIDFGFIQHITTSVQATYKSGKILTAKYTGKPVSDYGAKLDFVPDSTFPWYSPTSFSEGAADSNPVNIIASDTPGSPVPLTSDQAAVGIFDDNSWLDKDLITKITYKDTFSLDVAVRTIDGANNASSLYFAEASGDWSFDGSGTFKLNPKAAALKDKLLFTADKNTGVVAPASWTTVAGPTLEDITNLKPADWLTARTFS